MKSDMSLFNNIYPIIEKTLKENPKNISIFQNAVTAYMDKNMNKLSTSGPIYKTLFLDAEKNVLFNVTNTKEQDVTNAINDSSYIRPNMIKHMGAFSIISALLISYAKRNNNSDLAMYTLMYLVLSVYPSLRFKYFRFEPNPQIMDYTISNLSNKYKIKQQGTIWNALLETAVVCDKTYNKNIIKASDKDIINYIQAIKTRISALLKNIRNEYGKNYNDKNLVGVEKDNENPEEFSKAENNSYIIERISNSIALKLAMSGPDLKIVEIASKINDISVSDLRTVTTSITSDKENNKNLRKIIASILVLFISESQNSISQIRTNKFVLECLKIYKKSNTNDKNIIEIKRLLDKWLSEYSTRYKQSNRTATLNNFRKGLFTFFIFTIQLNAPS